MKASVARLRQILPRLGGAQPSILDEARVDAPEMSGRGIAAVIPALSAFLAGTVAFRYAYMLPLLAAGAAGLALGVVVLLFDMSLMSAAPGRSLPARIVTYLSRGLFSVLFAVTFAQPIVLFMFAEDIGIQVREDQQAELAAYYKNVILPRYASPIRTDTAQIAADQKQLSAASSAVAAAELQVESARVQAVCEAGGVSGRAGCQAGSGLVGQGRVYQVRLAELQNAEANLATARSNARQTLSVLGPQLASDRLAVAGLERGERADFAAAQALYLRDSGLIARWRALGLLERADPAIRTDVDLLALLIITVDLTAVLSKISSSTPSYNRVLAAERKKIVLRSAMSEEDADAALERWRAEREARAYIHQTALDAQVDVATEKARLWAEVRKQRMRAQAREETGEDPSSAAEPPCGRQQPPRSGYPGVPGEVVRGVSFSSFMRGSRLHEQMAAPMAPALARVAWTGLGLTGGLAIVVLLFRPAHAATAVVWTVIAALAAGAALAVYSRGFSSGPSWAHLAAFATAVLGLALPVLIFVPRI